MKKVSEFVTKAIQPLTIKMQGVMVTGVYISPNTKAEEKSKILSDIEKLPCRKVLIIGDLNERSKS